MSILDRIKTNKYQELYNSFLKHVEDWGRTGVEPIEGTKNVRRFLDLKEKRIQKYGLTEQRRFLSEQVDTTDTSFNPDVWRTGRVVKQRLEYLKDNHRIYKDSKWVYLATLVLDAEDGPGQKDQLYNCPNCGSIETLEQLSEEGCSYCHTRYEISELFPKVLNFYTLDALPESRAFYRILYALVGIPALCIAALPLIKNFLDPTIDKNILVLIMTLIWAALYFVFACIFIYLFVSFIFMIYVMVYAMLTMPFGLKMSRLKRKAKRYLKKIDPDFSYDYIESKAVTLLRTLAFSDDPQKLTIYDGKPLGDLFENVVDINYRGVFGLRKKHDDAENHIMTVELPMEVLIMKGNKIVKKNKNYQMVMSHSKSSPIRYNFSIDLVSCKSCGASFDAFETDHCPYCNSHYELKRDDWVVLDCYEA